MERSFAAQTAEPRGPSSTRRPITSGGALPSTHRAASGRVQSRRAIQYGVRARLAREPEAACSAPTFMVAAGSELIRSSKDLTVRDVVVDPNDPATVYLGTDEAGLWVTHTVGR